MPGRHACVSRKVFTSQHPRSLDRFYSEHTPDPKVCLTATANQAGNHSRYTLGPSPISVRHRVGSQAARSSSLQGRWFPDARWSLSQPASSQRRGAGFPVRTQKLRVLETALSPLANLSHDRLDMWPVAGPSPSVHQLLQRSPCGPWNGLSSSRPGVVILSLVPGLARSGSAGYPARGSPALARSPNQAMR